jgi:hypothetical protein
MMRILSLDGCECQWKSLQLLGAPPKKLVKNFKPLSELHKEHSDIKDLKKPNRNQNVMQS